MADAHRRGWRSGCVGCSGLLLALLAIGVVVVVVRGGPGFVPDHRCATGESGSCIRVGTGVVESANGFFDRVTVRYDDGRRTTTVTLRGSDKPAVGTRLRLEWWDGRGTIVALVDLANEHRYETDDSPHPWWEWALVFVVCVVALGVVFGIAALVGRSRRHKAGT